MGRELNLDVGPVAPESARTWIHWAHNAVCDLRDQPQADRPLPPQAAFDNLDRYLEQWAHATQECDASFRWHADVDPEELEYLTNAFYNLDVRLRDATSQGEGVPEPVAGRSFHLVMVRALLHALAQVSPARATFVEELRTTWPTAAQAG